MATPTPAPTSGTGFRAIEILKKAANLELVKKTILLGDGKTEFTMYCTPLVAAERDRANKNAKGSDNTFALHLLVMKAKDEHGQPLFTVGDIAELQREVADADLQKMILAVLGSDEADTDLDQKSDS